MQPFCYGCLPPPIGPMRLRRRSQPTKTQNPRYLFSYPQAPPFVACLLQLRNIAPALAASPLGFWETAVTGCAAHTLFASESGLRPRSLAPIQLARDTWPHRLRLLASGQQPSRRVRDSLDPHTLRLAIYFPKDNAPSLVLAPAGPRRAPLHPPQPPTQPYRTHPPLRPQWIPMPLVASGHFLGRWIEAAGYRKRRGSAP